MSAGLPEVRRRRRGGGALVGATVTLALCASVLGCSAGDVAAPASVASLGTATATTAALEAVPVPTPDPTATHHDRVAVLGEVVVLVEERSGNRLSATVDKVVPGATARTSAAKTAPGHHYVGVRFTFVNPGSKVMGVPGPRNVPIRLFLTDGRAFAPAVWGPAEGRDLDTLGLVRPGQAESGWLLFEVPEQSKPASVVYGKLGEWRFPASLSA